MKKFKKICILLFAIFLGILLIVATMFALESNHDDTGKEKLILSQDQIVPGQSVGGMIFKTIISLIFVLALMLLAVFGLKWLHNRTSNSGDVTKQLKIYGSISLGPKKSLCLVQVINRFLVLGVTDTNVSLLSEITDEIEIKSLLQNSEQKIKGSPITFKEHLLNFTKQIKS